MISNQQNNSLMEEIMKNLISKNSDGLKIVLETLFNLAMKEEREIKVEHIEQYIPQK